MSTQQHSQDTTHPQVDEQRMRVDSGTWADVVRDRRTTPTTLRIYASGERWTYHIQDGAAELTDATYPEQPSWMESLLRALNLRPA